MKLITSMIALVVVLSASALAQDLEIQTFGANGQMTFDETTNANWYSVEWATSLDGPWTSSWASLDYIPATGSGIVTAAVPMFYRAVAHEAPDGMTLIPASSFEMGDIMGDNTSQYPNDLPVHMVYVPGFFMDRCEVTASLWSHVWSWAITNGYLFDNMESVSATDHPIGVMWYDAVKWCNARSQMEGLQPVYYLDDTFSSLYVADRNDLQNSLVNWSANGYRLPTEAEWEKAARGGVAGMRFPWTDWTNCISFAKANYYAMSMYSYDLSNGTHPIYGGMPAPVGSFEPTGYGLFDMAGNVSEWCWDSYDSEYYHSSSGDNPHGPTNTTPAAVVRGGGCTDGGVDARCCARGQSMRDGYSGFRCVRRQ